MSSPSAQDSPKTPDCSLDEKSASEPPSKKLRKHGDSPTDQEGADVREEKDDSERTVTRNKRKSGTSHKHGTSPVADENRDVRRKKDQERERDQQSRKGRDRDSDSEKGYDKEKQKRRRDYEGNFERDPPANFERYWGAGPKRTSYGDRDRRRDYDRPYDHNYERHRDRRRDSGKVGPRYYGGKKDEEDGKDTKRSNTENKRASGDDEKGKVESGATNKPSEKKVVDMLTSRTGGAYIPPAKLRMMQAQITDKSSAAYQRIAWEALKKSIHGHINKVNTGNLATVIRELLKENLVRGCGLLCRSIIQAQSASPTFTRVFAALVAVINSRFPQIGELLVKRVVINFKRGFRRQDKASCISSAIFIAHLVNQSVAHELLALEILVLLVENPTSDSVEVAIAFLKEVVDKLLEVAKKGTMAIQDMLRNILHEGTLDKRVQYIIETMFQIIKVGGARKLDDEQKQKEDEELLTLVEEEDQITHIINLDDAVDPQNILDVFKEDTKYEDNEAAYKKLLHEILGSDSESGEDGSGEEEESDDEDEDKSDDEKAADKIIDNTETNLVALRRTIYLTIQSSLDFEECAHKLMRMQLKPGQEVEMCHMILDCCAEMRTYEKFFGLLAQRFCMINKLYISPFQQIFIDSFATVHRLEINKLRNVAKFFAHLLHTDAISWEVLSTCRLTEEDSTSSSRIFIKILFQELSEYMGLPKLNARVKDPTLQLAFEGLFPRDDPKNTRFAINFFTSIGLGGLTDELREHLKTQPKILAVPLPIQKAVETSSSSDSSSSSSSDSSSESSSSSSDSEAEKKKKKKNKSKQKQNVELSKIAKKKSEGILSRERDVSTERHDMRNDREQKSNSSKSRKTFVGRDEGQVFEDRYSDKESRRERERNNFERSRRKVPDSTDPRDLERSEKREREMERMLRKDVEKLEHRENVRSLQKEQRENRRDDDLVERRSRKDQRPHGVAEFEGRKGVRKGSRPYGDEEVGHREQKRDDLEERRGSRKESRPEVTRTSENERARERDRGYDREKFRKSERDRQENGDRSRQREKDKHSR